MITLKQKTGEGFSLHSEYELEADHLKRTLAAIEHYKHDILASVANPIAPTSRDARALREVLHKTAQDLEEGNSISYPYFARIDFAEKDVAETETFYIGPAHICSQGVYVVSWRAPFASLFYKPVAPLMSYKAPRGQIQGYLHLKRRIEIQNRTIS